MQVVAEQLEQFKGRIVLSHGPLKTLKKLISVGRN